MALKDRIATHGERQPAASGRPDTAFFRRELLKEVDLAELAELDVAQRRARLEKIVSGIVTRKGPVLSNHARSTLIRQVVDESMGLGVLEPLLADETITEIMVNGPDEVWIERNGAVTRAGVSFADEAHLYQTIDRMVSAVNRRVDESSPMVDARLPTGERVNVIIPPLALTGPTITIRRFPKAYTLEELAALGSLDADLLGLLAACVRARLSIMVSGGTGSGKTTLLNALSAFVPGSERIVTIEDAAELQLQQQHVVRLESRPANVEGRGAIAIRDLVRNSLRMRPDRIIVGEVRGAETFDMLQSMNTGHEGALATVHANSAEDAMLRLENLAAMSGIEIPYEVLRTQVNTAIDLVVHLERAVDGSRRIVEVAALTSRGRERYALEPVSHFVADALTSERRVTGRFEHGRPPALVARRLALAGEELPVAFESDADRAGVS